jgi:hypothetical protein
LLLLLLFAVLLVSFELNEPLAPTEPLVLAVPLPLNEPEPLVVDEELGVVDEALDVLLLLLFCAE